MKVICLYLLATTAVLMSGPQDCYRIRDRDSQNSCLAMAKGEKQYCYRIRNRDEQNMCLAQVTREKQYCYRITDWPDVPELMLYMHELGVKTIDCLKTFNWGVGYYASSNFVHVDVGRVRRW